MASSPDSAPVFARLSAALPWLLVVAGLLVMAGAAARLTQLPPLPGLRALEPVQQAQTALGYEGYLGALQRYLAAPSMAGVTELRRFQSSAEQAIMTLQGLDEPALDAPAWDAVLKLYQSATGRIEDSLGSGQAPLAERYAPLYAAYQRLATLSATVQLAGTNATQAALAKRAAQQRTLLWWLWAGVALALAGALWWLYVQRQSADMVVQDANGQSRSVRFGAAAQATFQGLVAELTRTVEGVRSADMPATLQTVEELCRALARTVALTHEDLTGTASAMRATGDRWQRSETQLDSLVAALETRAATVAEIAKLTGAQVQGSLKDIVSAQTQMRFAAGQVADTFTQSGGRAEELTERLLAATNLLRASGKVLQETVDSVRTRMLDATAALTQTDARLTTVIEHNNVRLGELASQAEAVLASGAASEKYSQEALATLTAASDRINATAQKLELSESDLGRAVATMLAQSDTFAPLTEQIRELHNQLSQGNIGTAAQPSAGLPDAMVARLEATADRLASLTDEMQSGDASRMAPLDNALDQLARLAQLTDTLGAMLGQLEKVATQQPVSAMTTAPATVIDNVELSDMAALRINASLQLVQGQVSELLQRLSGEQLQLIDQVAIVQRTCEQIRGQRFDPTHLDEALGMLGRQIERSHSGFTGELTGFLNRFEQALAVPLQGGEDSGPEVTPLARAILAKLRGENQSADAANAETVEAATAEISLRDALTRMTQIKKLTGALSRQSAGLSAMAANAPSAEATELAQQARTLITEVMDAISELSATAATITETADRLNQAG